LAFNKYACLIAVVDATRLIPNNPYKSGPISNERSGFLELTKEFLIDFYWENIYRASCVRCRLKIGGASG
jgi:hypothetical protein